MNGGRGSGAPLAATWKCNNRPRRHVFSEMQPRYLWRHTHEKCNPEDTHYHRPALKCIEPFMGRGEGARVTGNLVTQGPWQGLEGRREAL